MTLADALLIFNFMEKIKYSKEECLEKLKKCFQEKDYSFSDLKEINYGLQFKLQFEDENLTIRIFQSKKKGTSIDLSQIKNQIIKNRIELFFGQCINNQMTLNSCSEITKSEQNHEHCGEQGSLIGTDESGKGDFFGPLVIAGIFIEGNQEDIIRSIGVQDSKNLTDVQSKAIAIKLKQYPHSVVVIGPEKYNSLYEKIGNLNKLLAWGHGRVIENLLTEVDCQNVLSDQFGNESLIKNALLEKGKSVNLMQRHRAEENIVVAAASILARAAFLNYMDKMSREFNVEIPKGANKKVVSIGKKLVSEYGSDVLVKVSKQHFKTTEKVLG